MLPAKENAVIVVANAIRERASVVFGALTIACLSSCAGSLATRHDDGDRAAANEPASRTPAAPTTAATAASGAHDGDHGPIEAGLPERPIAFKVGIGRVHQDVTTSAIDAQRYFDQGLALLHDFAWIDAARSFHEVLRRDDGCALAWVGLSRAESGLARKEEARSASDRAKECAAKATPREQRFVVLRAQQLDAMDATGATQKELHAAYKTSLEQAIAEFPDEVELQMLRGNAEEPGPGGIGQVAEKGSIAWYEGVFTRAPDHFGAHHCLCHGWENAGDHAQAFAHADAYRVQTPAIPHSWHMCGHDLPRLGRWRDALAMFETSERLADEYAKAERLRPGDDWHRAHNLLLLGYTRLRLQFAGDAAAGDPIATFRQQFEVPIRSGGREYTHACYAEGLLIVGRDDEALAIARQLQAIEQSAATRAVGAALEGEILLARGDAAGAKAKLAQCDAAIAEDEAANVTDPGKAPKTSYRGIHASRELLAGLIELADGDGASGEQHLVALADDIAANPRFDAWGEGLFRIDRAWRVAIARGHPDLATKLRERMTKLDPTFDPGGAAGTQP